MSTAPPSPADATRQLLATLWERNRPLFLERIAELDAASEACAHHTLTPDARHSAMSTAHKLAGSLGMFGYPEGTELARKLEVLLGSPEHLNPLVLRELTTCLRESLSL